MNILIYNCYQFDDSDLRGGGVSVYLRNLIPAFLSRSDNVFFLSAGHRYSILSNKPKVKETENVYQARGVKSFQIVDSPVKAPAHDAFGSIAMALECPELDQMIVEMVKEHRIDEVHFHGIEGIASSVVRALKQYTNAEIKVWLHNYHWICPQIELFQNASKRCDDYGDGVNCVTCLSHIGDMQTLKKYQALGDFIERVGASGKPVGDLFFGLVVNSYHILSEFKRFVKSIFRSRESEREVSWRIRSNSHTSSVKNISKGGEIYRQWREENVSILNTKVDQLYAVSDIIKDQCEARGITKGKIKVTPIGMPDDNFDESFRQAKSKSKKVRVAFFGYAIPSKGLGLLIKAVEEMSDEHSDKFSFFVVSTLNQESRRDLSLLSNDLEVSVLEGYQRHEMGDILSEVDLVIVPSVFWESYNQVAYEAIRGQTPVLLSDTVGISMFVKDNNFIFKSGDKEDLIEKLLNLVKQPNALEAFWSDEPQLPSFAEHLEFLK